jgi:DNA-binding transcriptional ArsR family regulator
MSAGDSWESKVFRALASPTRLAVLRSLEKQPLNYTELLQATGLDRKTGSGKFAHHIRILLSRRTRRIRRKNKEILANS